MTAGVRSSSDSCQSQANKSYKILRDELKEVESRNWVTVSSSFSSSCNLKELCYCMSRIGLNFDYPWEGSLDDLGHTIVDRNVESDSDSRGSIKLERTLRTR